MSGPNPEAPQTAVPASELVGVRTREALVELMQAWGRGSSPAVLVVEDLRWKPSARDDSRVAPSASAADRAFEALLPKWLEPRVFTPRPWKAWDLQSCGQRDF